MTEERQITATGTLRQWLLFARSSPTDLLRNSEYVEFLTLQIEAAKIEPQTNIPR